MLIYTQITILFYVYIIFTSAISDKDKEAQRNSIVKGFLGEFYFVKMKKKIMTV